MNVIVSFVLIAAAAYGAITPLFLVLLPSLGAKPFYMMHRWRTWLVALSLIAALALALFTSLVGPVTVIVVALLAAMRFRLRPEHAIRALDAPPHLAADDASLSDDTPVIGIVVNGEARAWPMDIIIAHHLANDTLGGEPILVAY